MRGSSAGVDPGSLAAGADVVLHAPRSHGDLLAHGVLLDDWMSPAELHAVDAEARRRASAWLERHAALVTVAGTCIAEVHELQLHADVFLRETRIVEGLRALVRRGAPALLELSAVDPELAACLAGTLDGTEVASDHAATAPPRYPLAFAARAGTRGAVTTARETTGLPGSVRGAVLVEPYWHLSGLWGALAARPASVPVLNPLNPPALQRRERARLAARGGWMPSPG
ncbi:MAG: hypothetical protein ACR2GL_02370, partial [Thermoleophilaceae bacterium]